MPSGRPSIGPEFHARIERHLQAHPELGYQTTAELVKDLLRRWLDEQRERTAPAASHGIQDTAVAAGQSER